MERRPEPFVWRKTAEEILELGLAAAAATTDARF